MSYLPQSIKYERLTLRELDKAARSSSNEQRRVHLDQASVFATLGEFARGNPHSRRGSRHPNQAWLRIGTLAYAKRAALISALRECNYNIALTAAQLEIGRSTTYRLLVEYNIHMPMGTFPMVHVEIEALSDSVAHT